MARQTKRTPKAAMKYIAAQTPLLESKIEQFKDSLFHSVQATTPLLTGCYTNWLAAQTKNARHKSNLDTDKNAQQHFAYRLQAWERAQELFAQLTPIVLDELIANIANQIAAEYESVDAVTASDVSFQLRNVDLFDVMEYIN